MAPSQSDVVIYPTTYDREGIMTSMTTTYYSRKSRSIKSKHEGKTSHTTPSSTTPSPGCISQKTKNTIKAIIEHWSFSSMMAILTVYALFGEDVKLWVAPAYVDYYTNIINCVCLLLFVIEIILSSIAKDEYFGHFFFYLDTIATISLVTDITWIWDPVLLATESSGQQVNQASQVAKAGRAGRAGTRAGRIIRIVRLIRLIRVAKLYKHTVERSSIKHNEGAEHGKYRSSGNSTYSASRPLAGKGGYSHTLAATTNLDSTKTSMELATLNPTNERENQQDEDFDSSKENENKDSDTENESESRVGKKLSELTTRRVIVLVLLMLLGVPLLSEEQWATINNSGQYGAFNIAYSATEYAHMVTSDLVSQDDILRAWHNYQMSVLQFVQYHVENNSDVYIMFLVLPYRLTLTEFQLRAFADQASLSYDTYFSQLSSSNVETIGIVVNSEGLTPKDMRVSERELHQLYICEIILPSFASCPPEYTKVYISYFDKRIHTQLGAALSVGRTIFVCIVLTAGALLISKDANELVLIPIERMINKVSKIKENPMSAITWGEKSKPQKELEKGKGARGEIVGEKERKKVAEPYETSILEKTILKIGGLLALGFGEAGGEIIANNMTSSNGSLNAMVHGKRIVAIFGFCDIRQFTDTTEVLRERVMIFVNQIADIVHSIVVEFGGTANKNIGDAFLLVWKLRKSSDSDSGKKNALGNGKKSGGLYQSQGTLMNKSNGQNGKGKARGNDKKQKKDMGYSDRSDQEDGDNYPESVRTSAFAGESNVLRARNKKSQEQNKKGLGNVNGSVMHGHVTASSTGAGAMKKGRHASDNHPLTAEDMIHLNSNFASAIADRSVMSFLKIISRINTSPILAKYKYDEQLNERIPNYRVSMGFGLHVGWAIEGAIGSQYKIDASYLSPNVNMASRLEAATKQYGVPLLFSHWLYNLLSPQMKRYCRLIDRVLVKGSKQPVGLYTIDVNLTPLGDHLTGENTLNNTVTTINGGIDGMSQRNNDGDTGTERGDRGRRRGSKSQKFDSSTPAYTLFDTDNDIINLRRCISDRFIVLFRKAFSHYEGGEWSLAKDLFYKANQIYVDAVGVEDKPTVTLLHYMSSFQFVSPPSWSGFRELTEK